MGVSVNLDKSLIDQARFQSKILSRSVAKQIEHWAKIGHLVEDNPDLSYDQLKGIMSGIQDHESGNVKDYDRTTL